MFLTFILIGVLCIFVSCAIMKGWLKCVPIIIAVAIIGVILYSQHQTYRNQTKSDLYQINQQTRVLHQDQRESSKYQLKAGEIHNLLNSKRFKHLPKRKHNQEAKTYHQDQSRDRLQMDHYQNLSLSHRSFIREANRNLAHDRHKMHQLIS